MIQDPDAPHTWEKFRLERYVANDLWVIESSAGCLLFIDETAVMTKMVHHYGRSPRGERLVAKAPHGH